MAELFSLVFLGKIIQKYKRKLHAYHICSVNWSIIWFFVKPSIFCKIFYLSVLFDLWPIGRHPRKPLVAQGVYVSLFCDVHNGPIVKKLGGPESTWIMAIYLPQASIQTSLQPMMGSPCDWVHTHTHHFSHCCINIQKPSEICWTTIPFHTKIMENLLELEHFDFFRKMPIPGCSSVPVLLRDMVHHKIYCILRCKAICPIGMDFPEMV